MTRSCPADRGFTTIELMTVVLIISILLLTALPLYMSSQVSSAQRTCYANQRAIEGAVSVWLAAAEEGVTADLVGVVDKSHPLTIENFGNRVPRCPAAPDPPDPSDSTTAEGAYTLLGNGLLAPCEFGALGAHGHY
jgi:prepilin-type N-terminal cleavage/methylation domain-containing protein